MKPHHGVEQLTWTEARDSVKAVNPDLTKIIDNISPDNSFPLFRASYAYGSKIINQGVLQLPSKSGSPISIHDSVVPKTIKKHLGYNFYTNPVSLMLNKSAEIFFILDKKTIPLYGLIPAGKVFSTWKVLNVSPSHGPAFLWDMTAGARSILMLPKISEQGGHTRICKAFNIKAGKPDSLLSQWHVFREIANSPYFETDWKMDILFFGKKWFDHLFDDRFIYLQRYLYHEAWEGSNYFRHQFIWNLIFSLIQQKRHIKFDPYIANTVEHLLAIGIGVMPGFISSTNEDAAPIQALQSAYRDIYRLRKYPPIMMHLHNLSAQSICETIYYSLEYPTTVRFSPRATAVTRKLNDLIYIKIALNKYLEELKSEDMNIGHTPLAQLPDQITYDYFHNADNHYNIKPCESILSSDRRFQQAVGQQDFPKNSPFLQGCISISNSS